MRGFVTDDGECIHRSAMAYELACWPTQKYRFRVLTKLADIGGDGGLIAISEE